MKNLPAIASIMVAVLLFNACKSTTTKQEGSQEKHSMDYGTPVKADFQKEVDGKQVDLFTLTNSNGIEVKITNFGAKIVSIVTPDKDGNFTDIAFGYNTIDEYLKDPMYLGCAVGRYANRIDNAEFTIDGETYKLAQNDGKNSLHGGVKGYDKVVWDATQDSNKVMLTYLSPDGEEGYPGNLKINLTYELNDANELICEYSATTDKKTVVNLTNHSFFNLKGEGDSTILDHKIMINSDKITPVNETLIPTGEYMPVEGTPFDFRKAALIGKGINADHQQIKYGGGYDHNWVLNKEGDELSLAVRLSEKTTGRILELYTTEPGVQFYAGNFMDGSVTGKSGKKYQYRSGLAVEPQHYPDSPNQPEFPSTLLEPGDTYTQTSKFKFSVVE